MQQVYGNKLVMIKRKQKTKQKTWPSFIQFLYDTVYGLNTDET